MADLRIISLLPAATEMVYALGLAKNLVGVSDDSDFPRSVLKLPKVVTTTLPAALTSREIDKRVRQAKHRGIGIFHTDKKLLKKLNPNLILSQELCEVCAIGTSVIKKAARILKDPFKTISLEPENMSDVLENILLIGSLTDKSRQANLLVKSFKKRIKTIIHDSKFIIPKPKVLILEWLDPLMTAGHWVPEMVELAGGRSLLTKKGEVSKRIEWGDVLKADPDILIIAPCGFDIVRAKKEINLITSKRGFKTLKSVKEDRVYFIDGNAYLTRPGPRIVDGIEILAEVIHPKIFKRKYPSSSWQKAKLPI